MPRKRVTPPEPAIRRAMVLAAGLGTRMGDLTRENPKPLLLVAGRSMLDRTLDGLAGGGVAEAVVNTHHLGRMIADHLADRARPRIRLSPEEALLDTGGGVAHALPHLGPGPFYVVNGDAVWIDGPRRPALERLAAAWDDEAMDALLLLYPARFIDGYTGFGDFLMDPAGRVARRPERELAPFVFTGLQVLHPRLFQDGPKGAFSLNRLYDAAQEAGRLYGLVHDGDWFHVGTAEAIEETEAFLAGRYRQEDP